jgi:hypothetical protein
MLEFSNLFVMFDIFSPVFCVILLSNLSSRSKRLISYFKPLRCFVVGK